MGGCAVTCSCRACSLSCEPHECERNATHPLPWRAELDSLVAGWHGQHLGRHELDAADVALDLGLVDLGFVGADLWHISAVLVEIERDRDEPHAAVVTYSRDGERMGPRCPRCLAPRERHGCGAELMSEPLPLEVALRMSTAGAVNDSEAA